MFESVRFAGRPGRRRWRVLAGLALLALALHAWLLQGIAGAVSAPNVKPAPVQVASVQVRTVAMTEATVAPSVAPQRSLEASPARAPQAAAATTAATAQTAPRSQALRPTAEPVAEQPAPPPSQPSSAAPEPIPPTANTLPAAAETATASASAPAASQAEAPAAPASDDETPEYRTLIPPPLTLKYGLRRGLLSGTGELAWRPDGDHYEARLEGRVAGLSVLTQVSQGGFDHAGLAPLRFTDQRLRGAARAANFQRERGEITFSGPSDVLSLLVGAQDRLSWMIQLAAIASAEPQRLAAGGKVVMYVVGARADAAVWVFRSQGAETVDTDAGPVRAVKFVRESSKPYDTQVEAWLDPARHHLPVRARLVAGGDGDALELLLQEMQEPP